MTKRVLISPMTRSGGGEFIAAAIGSKRLHTPWVSPPLSRRAYAARVDRLQAPKDFAFLVRRRDNGALVGYIDVTNVVRGLFQRFFTQLRGRLSGS
jgi:ribosomal-protein-alanine N-acetyltransferase